MNEDSLYSTSQAAYHIGVSCNTLKRWYKWFENDAFEKPEGLILPEYLEDNRKTKFFDAKGIEELRQFKDDLQGKYNGVMADFNAYWQWGQRGKKILKRKEEKREQKNG